MDEQIVTTAVTVLVALFGVLGLIAGAALVVDPWTN